MLKIKEKNYQIIKGLAELLRFFLDHGSLNKSFFVKEMPLCHFLCIYRG